ncbi:adhesin biosynthesis transcription regulatory family protein [Shewanella sp. FJAT-51649]|uniref:adhesin biosynthesis transcription regulatory family protein n=1 Tax=Shewanella sp. FJAT-51649 TaxID=2864210 RepID=UPI001C65A55B|nr:adhesin biosynthesis transcription regulatory family protein [Shewanella sp. FJAT-51649]QYJ72421.1 adhesin biosynthesis transcription regulatory family protein [Shewanella sp. FJAT-51649]
MNYLIQGGETSKRLKLLVSLTRIDSKGICEALEDYYVLGFQDTMAVARNSIDAGNFSRARKRLEAVAETVERIKEIDWINKELSVNRQ